MSSCIQARSRAQTLRPWLAVGLAGACLVMAACDRRPADPTKPSTDSGMAGSGPASVGTPAVGATPGSTGSTTPGSTTAGSSTVGTDGSSGTGMPPVAPVPSSAPQPSPAPASGTMR